MLLTNLSLSSARKLQHLSMPSSYWMLSLPKYSVGTVQSDAAYYFKIPTLIKTSSAKEKLQWVNDLADLVFTLPKYSAVINGEVPVETLGPTGIMELKGELDQVRENFAAHMLLALCPDAKYQRSQLCW